MVISVVSVPAMPTVSSIVLIIGDKTASKRYYYHP